MLEAVVGDVADLEAANTERLSRPLHLRGNAVTDQHCSPRAVRTPVATRNLNPDVARSVATIKPANSAITPFDLDRSVNFYRDVFECHVALHESEAAFS